MTLRTMLLSIVALAGLAGSARAECRSDANDGKPVAFHMARIDGKLTMVIEDGVIVCGHPARPAVAIVPSPTTPSYMWETLEQTLLPKIIDAVNQAPLRGGSR
ncbi:MAG: hypothetical protein ABI867_10220 [Kofleriaceae bacterium]